MAELVLLAGVFVAAAVASLLTDAVPVPREALYILTGLAIGQLVAVPAVAPLAEVGAVLLIFLITMNLQTDGIMDVLPTAAWAVSAQAALLVVAASASLFAGFGVLDALLIGLAASMSSSMLGVDMVGNQVDRRLLHGRLTEAVTAGQDVAAVLIVAAIPFWPDPIGFGAAAFIAVGILAAVRAQGVVKRVLAWLDREEATTVMVGLTVLWLATAAAEGYPHGSIIGAVLVGFLFAGHPENLTLLETLEPIRDFFAAVFFVLLGVMAGVPSFTALTVAAGLVLVIALVRPAVTVLALRWRGVDLHSASITALQIDQVSEIVLLLALLLRAGGEISATVFQAVVFAAALTFIASRLTTLHANRIYLFLHSYLGHERDAVERTGHVIVAGYGGWGRAACDVLEDPVVIDNDPEKVERARAEGYTALLGDVHDHTTWRRASTGSAEALVLTVPSDRAALNLAAREDGFDLVAVTETPEAAEELRENGVLYAADDGSIARKAFRDALRSTVEQVRG